MARNLKKFVNPQFSETVPLEPLRRLLERHPETPSHVDLGLFDTDPNAARRAVLDYLKGDADTLPDELVGDLHRIAELASRQGFEILLQQCRRFGVAPAVQFKGGFQDPKEVALRTLLDRPDIFDAAHKLLGLFQTTGIAEFAGLTEGVEPQVEPPGLEAFRNAAAAIFEAELQGNYCMVEHYEDGPETVLVVGHGAPIMLTTVVEERKGLPKAIRTIEQAILSYSAAGGRLKMAGVSRSKRVPLAEAFATCLLDESGFFRGPDAQNLYTLAPVERAWPDFAFTHRFDASIRKVQVVEAQVDRVSRDLFGEFDKLEWSFIARDSKDSALVRLHEAKPEIEFNTGDWRIGHLVLRVRIDTGGREPASVTVKVKPRAAVTFRRHRFEAQIMELLRRNGICCDRDTDRAAVAAE
ncbi:MAG: hypothetical protein KDJ88_17645 [Bauldia sp.]|nr:hypothetical protein [Bauldia sp.]